MKAIPALLLLAAAPAFAAPDQPATCPQAGEQLSDYLASAKRRINSDGEVRVEFDVDARGRAQVVSLDGSRPYRTPVRIAVSSLDCQRGVPQRYVVDIRFADRARVMAAAPAASATLAEASGSR
mgnify:CR=1 FL=1